MEHEGSGGSGGSAGLLQQILSLKLVPRVGNGTLCPNSTSLCSFPGTGPAPRRACALGCQWPPPGCGAPLPPRLRPAVPLSPGSFPPGRRFPLPRPGAGGCSSSSVASSPAPLAGHSDSALGARAEGAAASRPVNGGTSASTRTDVALWSFQKPQSQAGTRQSLGGGRPS